jgi:hypothetical protein
MMKGSRSNAWRILAAGGGSLCACTALAGEPWLAPGDVQVRHDVQLLVDTGAIDLPTTGWPLAASDLANALDHSRHESKEAALTAAQQAAMTRLRRIASPGRGTYGFDVAGAARPMPIRGFAETPREEAELHAHAAGFFGSRYGGRLEVAVASDPDDDETVRFDGSYVAGKFGNWIVTAGAQERWWGSGWDGSLILSNNARPVPALALDRAVSDPFESKWLRWIGPWRLTTFMGRMEGDREDFDHPLLFGMRISARPLEGLEISLERTAQWCGEGRSCNWDDFWNLWSGNDNRGENVDPEDEPGNQLAGWDIRWASPLGNGNYAVYWQHTGETIDNQIPRPYRSLELAGVEFWGASAVGDSSWRAGLEWANTRCGGTENGQKLWDCAYNNEIFSPDGYRYYGRVLGHPMDGDGDTLSARFIRVGASGDTLTAIARMTSVNEGGVVPDERHSIAAGPEDWLSLDLSYRRSFGPDSVEAGIGVERRDQTWLDDEDVLGRAWVAWRRSFQ